MLFCIGEHKAFGLFSLVYLAVLLLRQGEGGQEQHQSRDYRKLEAHGGN
jgi:hypothetical protein